MMPATKVTKYINTKYLLVETDLTPDHHEPSLGLVSSLNGEFVIIVGRRLFFVRVGKEKQNA